MASIPTPKTCFVTIGATASFSALVEAVLSPPFLVALKTHGYSDLLVQYGADGKELFASCVTATAAVQKDAGVAVSGFDLDRAGLKRYMLHTKAAGGATEGVVISHAGSYLSIPSYPTTPHI